jgi:hypothetical protein
MVSEGNESTQGMFRTLGVAIALLLHEHLHLVRATLEIARSRFRFGQKIKNTSDELAKALAYLAESLLVITLAIKLRRGSGHLGLLPEFPLSEEIEPLIYSLFVIYIGIGGHWIACLFSKQRISPAATLAAYAYWYGFIQTLLPVVLNMPNNDTGLSGIMEVLFWVYFLLSGFIGILLLVSFLFLFNWIASIHKISILKAVAAYWIGAMVTLLPLAAIGRALHIS